MRRLLTLAGCLVLVSVGCKRDLPQTAEEIDDALTYDYGGIDDANEAPGFNDGDIIALAVEDVPAADDALAADPDVVAAEADAVTRAAHLRVLLVWGHQPPGAGSLDPTDWSGTITVTGAALRVLRLVSHEEGDAIVLPRPDSRTVTFTSITSGSTDGLLLDLVVHPRIAPDGTPITLTFSSAALTQTLTLAVGERTGDVVPVGDAGDVFAWQVFASHVGDCVQGYLTGTWHEVGSILGRPVGLVKGRWLGDGGVLRGTLRGVFGKRRSGSRVFFAKLIDVEGKLSGVLAGHHAAGRFTGLMLDGAYRIGGYVRGAYWDSLASDGAFVGRWSHFCDEWGTEGSAPADDEATPAAQ